MAVEKVTHEGSDEYHYVGSNFHTICGLNFWTWSAPLMLYQAVTREVPPDKTLCPTCRRIATALQDEKEI